MKVFLSGIGGIGMSAYAGHLLARGEKVYGTDKALTPITEDLLSLGAIITNKQDGSAIPGDSDLFVYSEAIPSDSPERKKAEELGIRSLSYFQALGELTQGTFLIAVAGSHGKSSTTAMAAKMLIDSGMDPSIVVGTKMFELNGKNWRSGKSDLWIVEACEYRKSFLSLRPLIILLTNIETDHFDAFPTEQSYDDAFAEFTASLPENGVIVYHGSDERSAAIVKKSGRKCIDADDMALPILKTPGEHMRQNAQLVLALARHLGIEEEAVLRSLGDYGGSWRRMEEVGETTTGAVIIDDYAHHPTEIRVTLRALKEKYADKRIIVVFQPHTHERTLTLWNDFAGAFSDADTVVLLDVYDARPDTEKGIADAEKLARDIRERSGHNVIHVSDVNHAAQELQTMLQKGDLCVTMGAGNIGNLPALLLS